MGCRHHFNRFTKRHSVKGIILREKDLIQSNNDIKNTNTPSERAKKTNEWSKNSSRSENVHLNDENAVIRYERLSHSYHIRVMDRIARRLRGDTTQTKSTLCADSRTCAPRKRMCILLFLNLLL